MSFKNIDLWLIASLLIFCLLMVSGEGVTAPFLSAGAEVDELYDYLFELRENVVERRVELSLTDAEAGERKKEMLAEHQEKGSIYIVPYYLPRAWFFWEEWPSLEDKIRALEYYSETMAKIDIEKERRIDVRESTVTEHLQSKGLSDKEVYQRFFALRKENVNKSVEQGWITPERGDIYLEMLAHNQERGSIKITPFYAPKAWFSWEEWPDIKDKLKTLENHLRALNIKYEARQDIPK